MAKTRRYSKRPNQSSRTWLVVIVIFVVAALLVGVKSKIPLLPASLPTQVAADTTLSFVPDAVTGKAGETKTVAIAISSGKNTVTGAEFQLSLDPSIARMQKASAGTFFDQPTVLANAVSNSGGLLHFAVGSLTPKQGSGTVVTLTVRLVKPGSTTLSFSDVKIAAVGAGSTNVSRVASPVTVVVAKL